MSNQPPNSLIVQPEGSANLIPKPATGHDPEQVPYISLLHGIPSGYFPQSFPTEALYDFL
jgi:hypothetical protein